MKNFLLSSLLLVFTCASFGTETEVAETEVTETEVAETEVTETEVTETEEVEMEGVLIERPDGSFMQFTLFENKFHCNFFSSKMEPIDPDVDRVAIRYVRLSSYDNRFAVAIPYEGGRGLKAPIFIRPPHILRVYLSVMRDGIKDPVEFYIVFYPQDTEATEPITIYEGDPV
jgi:hypothetical protein